MVNIGDKLHPESLVKYLGIHVRPASPDGKQAEMRGIRLELPDETEIIGMEEKILRLYRRMLLAGHTNLPLPESSTGQQFIDAVKDFKPFIDAGKLTEEDLASALDILYGEGFAERLKADILREAAEASHTHIPPDRQRSPE